MAQGYRRPKAMVDRLLICKPGSSTTVCITHDQLLPFFDWTSHDLQSGAALPRGTMDWDAERGVWSSAQPLDLRALPSPLYVFGYGSLIWRPAPGTDDLPAHKASARGFRRLFAQRSFDHRGTPLFPGMVLNLVSDDVLKGRGYPVTAASECEGVVWMVPSDRIPALIAELDSREKGGYLRHAITVTLHEASPAHAAGSEVPALVYTGPPDNPNFFLPPYSPSSSAHPPQRGEGDLFGLRLRNATVDIITAAAGPSGPNMDYLFNLVQLLEERGITDTYLQLLATAVRLRLGPSRLLLHGGLRDHAHARHDPACVLWGWGSNEFGQLAPTGPRSLLTTPRLIAVPGGAVAASDLVLVAGGGSTALLLRGGRALLQGTIVAQIQTTAGPATFIPAALELRGVVGAALGADRALLVLGDGELVSVGSSCEGVRPLHVEPLPCDSGYPSLLATAAVGNPVASVGQAVQAACGVHVSAVITASGALVVWTRGLRCGPWAPLHGAKVVNVACGAKSVVCVDSDGRVYSMGSNRRGALGRQREGLGEAAEDWSVGPQPVPVPAAVRILRVTCGWTHTVARGVAANGAVVVLAWGRKDMGQYLPACSDDADWVPRPLAALPGGHAFAEVWCGAESTVAADEEGGLWGCGWNEHANLSPIQHEDDGSLRQWRRIGATEGLRIATLSEGTVACSGGHTLCLAHPQPLPQVAADKQPLS